MMEIPGLDPYVFRIGRFGVRWYGLFVALSIAVGIYYFVNAGRRRRLSEDFLYNLALVAVVGGIVGSRLVYVATNLDYYLANPAMIIRTDLGGLSFHGAVGGGVLAGLWYVARNRVPAAPLMTMTVAGLDWFIALASMARLATVSR